MSSYRERLDFLALKERVSLVWKLTPVVIGGVLILGAVVLLYMPGQVDETSGTLTRHKTETSETSVDYLFVRLDDGRTVRARTRGHVRNKPGRRVILKKTTTRLFGYTRYEFNRYVEEQPEIGILPWRPQR